MLVPGLTSSLEAYPQALRCAASTTTSTMSLATTSTASSRPIWTQAVPHLSEAILTPEAKEVGDIHNSDVISVPIQCAEI